ncbi:hypothetical protein [Pseudomonas sp. NPDC087690]|jgi:predicted house-cleaning noncanonical NTP pyrophosphatase (MazG superfamily)|uniref:hypothetical protein n=1 Tax=Pseudomonas sp. NPDC087690 TaxID=3364446 RepID=UPI000F07A769
MLIIRDAQMAALLRGQDSAYTRSLAERLRRDDPGLCSQINDEQLARVLSVVVEKARCYGFSQSIDVLEFFSATRRFSAHFDEAPCVFELLGDLTMAPSLRIYNVLQLPIDKVQQELSARTFSIATGSQPC